MATIRTTRREKTIDAEHLRQLPETLRSAGARVVLKTGFYKHLAPLEPEPCLVAA